MLFAGRVLFCGGVYKRMAPESERNAGRGDRGATGQLNGIFKIGSGR